MDCGRVPGRRATNRRTSERLSAGSLHPTERLAAYAANVVGKILTASAPYLSSSGAAADTLVLPDEILEWARSSELAFPNGRPAQQIDFIQRSAIVEAGRPRCRPGTAQEREVFTWSVIRRTCLLFRLGLQGRQLGSEPSPRRGSTSAAMRRVVPNGGCQMRYLIILLSLLSGAAIPAMAQVSIGVGIGAPNANIGINFSSYPRFEQVPGYPVYYAPQIDSNYFFYDGMYWVYANDNWYASSWYNGPWALVEPMIVPVYVLRVPVRYYRNPPMYFRGWQQDGPPRWDDHWGNDWRRQRSGWNRWDRNSMPPPAPLPTYQQQYSGGRYPSFEQQRIITGQNYHYRPHEPVIQQHYQRYMRPTAPVAQQDGSRDQPHRQSAAQQDANGAERPHQVPPQPPSARDHGSGTPGQGSMNPPPPPPPPRPPQQPQPYGQRDAPSGQAGNAERHRPEQRPQQQPSGQDHGSPDQGANGPKEPKPDQGKDQGGEASRDKATPHENNR
jgi:hypothetical protein